VPGNDAHRKNLEKQPLACQVSVHEYSLIMS